MHYIVYCTRNLINNKIYVGVHQTLDLNDGYLGSGLQILAAIKKYGKHNFERTILFKCEDPIEMLAKEAEIINEEFVNRLDTYNLKIGGIGTWHHINSSPKAFLSRSKGGSAAAKRWEDPLWSAARVEQIKKYSKGNKSFTGRNHTDTTKQKIGRANSVNTGEKNSQYGTCWIYNKDLKLNKKIKSCELPNYEVQGWLKGRILGRW